MIYYQSIEVKELLKYFDPRVRDWCKQCKRYNKSGSCPENIGSIEEYKNIVAGYKNAKIVVMSFEIKDPSQWKALGKFSSEQLRYAMLNYMKKSGIKSYLIYGAGSCKNCEICTIPCSIPNKRLYAIEAIGINVVKLIAENTPLRIQFPVEKHGYFMRVGLMLW